jgi:NADH:ubiquinone oxidoreductase subunit 4 (subunit M)
MSRYELVETIQQLRKYKKNLSGIKLSGSYQASGAIALMVDTGFIGIFLYLLNLLLGFLAILKSQNKNKYVISIVYLSVVLFSFVGTLTSVLLFYFWVMPKNPILLMLGNNEKKI